MKMVKFFQAVAAVVLTVAIVACENETPQHVDSYEAVLTLTSEAEMNFEAVGGQGTITFTAEMVEVTRVEDAVEPTASCEAEWVTIDATGTDRCDFTVAANEDDARDAQIVVKYGDKSFTVAVKQAAKPAENPTPQPSADPRIGDIYYSDGTWSTEFDESKTPVGVIFCLGAGHADSASFYTTKGGQKMDQIRGYVVALKDATKGVNDDEGVVWSFYDGWYNGAGCSSELDDFLGYTNTQSIKQAALRDDCPAGEFNGTEESFPAAWYASDGYEILSPAPATSSGWYLPSIYQLQYIWDKVYFNDGNMLASVEDTLVMLAEKGLADVMYAVDSEYWSSTERYDSYGDSCQAYYFCFDEAMFQPGFGSDLNKYWKVRVRSILTF